MPQDAFTIYHTALELNNRLKGARIDKINQPTSDTVTFSVRTLNKNEKLVISANAENARVAFTDLQKEAPYQAPSFCMLLRKYLIHATVDCVEAVPYERIIKITFNTKNEMREAGVKVLYAEIMGKYSNITLTENDKILGAIKQSQSLEGLRPIFPGVSYKLPAPQDKVELSNKEASLSALNSYQGGDFSKYIFTTFKGLSRLTANEVVYRFFGSSEPSIQDVKNCNIIDFYKHFVNFYETRNYLPNVVSSNDINDFFITDYKSVNENKKYYDDLLKTIDLYFDKKESTRAFGDKKRKLLSVINAADKKVKKKYQIALEKILACKNMQNDRIYGELIISNLYRIKNGLKEVELENYYSPDYQTVKIPLDEKLSPKENAERYFKKYNKEKKTVASVEPQIKELEENLKYLQSLYDEIDLCQSMQDFTDVEEELIQAGILKTVKKSDKKKEAKSTYRTYCYKGFIILVGRNNLQNTRLTSSAERNDLWLHTKDYHSAHVIIKTEGRLVPDDVLLYAAEICAFYSKASKSDKVPVDYTLKKYVKRPAGLPLGMVYYTDNKTILVTPNAHL